MGNRCQTVYPIILVHGSNSRDFQPFAYWGRIPQALEAEGAEVFYGGQDAWGTIETNAAMLKVTVKRTLKQTDQSKVNIIAHSKGGLEARYMISALGMAPYVASLTTIATPHYGCKMLDYFYHWPTTIYRIVSLVMNTYCRILGDKTPDFYTATRQLSTYYCRAFNEMIPDAETVYYQSYAAAMQRSLGDLLLSPTHLAIRIFEGENDGLVAVKSAQWGSFKGTLRSKSKRGISHADLVDYRRKDLDNFDIRKFYLKIAADLKTSGF